MQNLQELLRLPTHSDGVGQVVHTPLVVSCGSRPCQDMTAQTGNNRTGKETLPWARSSSPCWISSRKNFCTASASFRSGSCSTGDILTDTYPHQAVAHTTKGEGIHRPPPGPVTRPFCPTCPSSPGGGTEPLMTRTGVDSPFREITLNQWPINGNIDGASLCRMASPASSYYGLADTMSSVSAEEPLRP